jgi:hypothetical protein
MMRSRVGLGIALAMLIVAGCRRTGGSAVDEGGGARKALPARVSDGVVVRLERLHAGEGALVFGVPLVRGALADARALRVRDARSKDAIAGAALAPILYFYDASGKRTGVRALRVELPGGALAGTVGASRDIEISWAPDAASLPAPAAPAHGYADTSVPTEESVTVVDREIEKDGLGYKLAEKSKKPKLLHRAWEPRAQPRFADGYLASTGLFGELLSSAALEREGSLSSLRFYSDAARAASKAVTYELGYLPSSYPGTGKKGEEGTAAVPDPIVNFEAWLYDRCATMLIVAAHFDDPTLYRHGLRACSFYASEIDEHGLFKLKLDEKGQPYDEKYSHVRGLFIYYALSGDERAERAIVAMANMWDKDEMFAKPYRAGHARGRERLWTERLVAAALEAGVYGFETTGEARHLTAAKELFNTLYAHITAKDAKAIEAITYWSFPPQDCLIHSSLQHENDGTEPWCSGWMSALLAEPLLRYQELTGDQRADEVFVRLARFLRDRATTYFSGDPLKDSFLEPSMCFDKEKQGPSVRFLSPLYAAGLRNDGTRYIASDWADFDHCPDVTLITAAALRALKRSGGWDRPAPKPFRNEGASILALHHELAYCSFNAFGYYIRERRDPRVWTSRELAEGYGQAGWLEKQKIGWPTFDVSPLRKYGWWFNGSLETWAILKDAGMDFSTLRPGAVQPPGKGCPQPTQF